MNAIDRARDALRSLGHDEQYIAAMQSAVCPVCGRKHYFVSLDKPETCGNADCMMKETAEWAGDGAR